MGDRPQRRPAVISIGRTLQEYRFRGLPSPIKGYPVRFRKAADRELFKHNNFVLFPPNFLLRNTKGETNWKLCDSATGAFWCRSDTSKALRRSLWGFFLHWDLYKLILACRIDTCNNEGVLKWGHIKSYSIYTDEFNALLVAAKMEGLNSESKLKDIKKLYATNAKT